MHRDVFVSVICNMPDTFNLTAKMDKIPDKLKHVRA